MGWDYQPPPQGRRDGVCAWCGCGPCELHTAALPAELTQWDAMGIRPDDRALCTPCVTALMALKPIKWGHMLVTESGAVMSDDPTDLKEWLSTPVEPDRAVLVATNRQKRSLISARWGGVATSYDGVSLAWGADDCERLTNHDWLRWEHGVSEKEIRESAPRPQTLGKSAAPREMLSLWASVRQWDAVALEVSCLATRRTKAK